METPHPHGFGPLAFQWWSFSATWHFMKCLQRSFSCPRHSWTSSMYTLWAVRTLPARILENANTKALITLCCAFHIFCPAQWEQMHWHETEVRREQHKHQAPPSPQQRQQNKQPQSPCAAMSPSLERDRIKGHLQSHSLPRVIERSLQWCPRREQDKQWGWTRPWEAVQMAGMPSVWLSQCPLTPSSELIKGNEGN